MGGKNEIKKVLLVSPRFNKGRHQISIHPLAGLGYIAESLKNNGFEVNVFDMNLQYSEKDLAEKIHSFLPDMVGFLIMTFGYKDTYRLIEGVKELEPNVKIAVGGPHISTLKEKVLQECSAIDYGVLLEGDKSFVRLCLNDDVKNIPGIVYRAEGKIRKNEFNEFIENLNELPFPRYEAFELEKYPVKQIGIVTSRGCPYKCIYCPVVSAIGRKFRARNADNIAEEIEYWHSKGYREILILDDNFTLVRSRVEELCWLLINKDLKDIRLKCPNGIRADKTDYELLKLMRKARFDMISFGVESASSKVLKNINKDENIDVIEEAIKNACSLGFEVSLFFIIGSPGETPEDVQKSFSLALKYPVAVSNFYNIIPFPDTELFDWISKNKYFLRPLEDIMNNASHFINEPCFFTPEMSYEERKRAFKNGKKISKIIRKRFIEKKLKGPEVLKRLFSCIYTIGVVEQVLTTNKSVIKLKEKLKQAVC
ncbi:MAG: radical SAM protein [Candidatus Omnitrophota bacterium]|nr:B12-binding domain-containing radical SAM protein [Candidatus Omnitrophota bacterium]